VTLTLRQKERLAILFEGDKDLEIAIAQFFREQGIFYTGKLVKNMKSIPPETDQAIQNAAIASEYENIMSAFKHWASRQV
jgi:hypothetical protein